MAEQLNSDRVRFPTTSGQIRFLENAKNTLKLSYAQLAGLLGIHPRTLHEWSKATRTMPYSVVTALSLKIGMPIPRGIKIIKWNEHLKKIAVQGGKASYVKNGFGRNPDKRKKEWEKWWKTKGRFERRDILLPKEVFFPRKSIKLAEFVGIMMGDGGVSKYHLSITLNSKTDKEYAIFVCELIKDLFHIDAKTHKRKDSLAMDIVVNRVKLISFCKSIGLKVGNKLKQNLDIPEWINANKNYQIACLRGLIDTDGSFFKHRYTVKGKKYCYDKIGFSSRSPELIHSVHKILTTKLCINAKINYNGNEVKLESGADVKRYIALVGTNNPKHKGKISR
jgi:hypothetical protein